MKEELRYGLVTSSALPQEIAASEYYAELDKTQWLDLVDYSEELVETDKDQEILFLIVAKGTEEQVSKDEARRQTKELERSKLNEDNLELSSSLFTLKSDKDKLSTRVQALTSQIHELSAELGALKEEEATEDEKARTTAVITASKKKDLRKKSISLFNALYSKD